MSNNRLKLEGLTEFRTALRHLPDELKDEANEIVRDTADRARGDVQSAYPQGPTGNLRRGVTREEEHSRFGVSSTVKSRAKHSHLFERGTGERRTAKGWNRGRMPEAPQQQRMIPIVIRHRKQMLDKLKALVRRAGFQVE